MIKLLNIIGARPQIIKSAALSRAIREHYADKIQEVILHTGQHYDDNMSQIFFDELGISRPNHHLSKCSELHGGAQTAQMIEGIEQVLIKDFFDFVVLYGDTNSTLAGSLAAAKLHIPIIHIEAGLRSFNKRMPEEINRIVCDHVSTLLFSPTLTGVNNLIREGFRKDTIPPYSINNPRIYHCGDIMYDNTLYFADIAEKKSTLLNEHKLTKNNYLLVTIHRDNNTDDTKRLNNLFSTINKISNKEKIDIIIPLHPRTKKMIDKNLNRELYQEITQNPRMKIISAISFFDMLMLEKNAMMIMTDSGGVQKEAYFFHKPCIILRSETEWIEIINTGNGIITDTDAEKIISAYHYFKNITKLVFPVIFGNGHASEFICEKIIDCAKNKITL